MISISSRLTLALLVVSPFLPAQALTLSLGECTILIRSELRLDGIEKLDFECILDPTIDADGVEDNSVRIDVTDNQMEMIVPIDVTDEQMEMMKEKVANGTLVSNVSTLKIDAAAFFDLGDEVVHLPSDPVNFEFGTRQPDNGRRRLATVTGTKPILVVRVTDSEGRNSPEEGPEISDDIFGSLNDSMTLKSQMYDCSFGQLNIVPGDIPGQPAATAGSPGVIEVTINVSLLNTRSKIMNAVTSAVYNDFGISLPGQYQQVMYVLEGCYQDCGWAAYAYVNSWLSVYQGVYYKLVGVQMHEIGHNFNLLHSGGLDGKTYTDHTGVMGNPLYHDDIGAMCFNAAKTWQIGWYDTRKENIDPRKGDWSGTIIGIADFNNNNGNYPVVVKIETGTGIDQFIAFNRATGVNRHNDEADDEVTIVETSRDGEGAAQSYLKAHLLQGEEYFYPNWDNSGKFLIVKATKISINTAGDSAPSYAEVEVCLGVCGAETPVPTPFPTPLPTPRPMTSSPAMTSSPTPVVPNCEDSTERFQITKPDGTQKMKTCDWVKQKWAVYRCDFVLGAKENCPKTCTNCCQDTIGKFLLSNGKSKSCEWAGAEDTEARCNKSPTRIKCAVTCGAYGCSGSN